MSTRGLALVRVLRIVEELRACKRGIPLRRIADRHGWRLRTVYRDIAAIEEAGLPVVRDGSLYRIER